MLAQLIEEIGTVKVAKACGVSKGLVSIWKRNGTLPYKHPGNRTAGYERAIARLAGMPVAELRKQIRQEGAA
ncbi:hypothetical protein C7446_2537 [Kushneria sinocarnis]|uniref:YdaS antitoxin of YdaST toxin-antitoxin system n=1 Tax=Kushneria sinocarnis TaxID=595502 RepID=A0A420WUJ8_9GAMM|nr:DNA-binding protein [Kushneria sinocarnis]RKQ97118.1 hypothetical protein C7446_2537 [Kushneria sinocarnis]